MSKSRPCYATASGWARSRPAPRSGSSRPSARPRSKIKPSAELASNALALVLRDQISLPDAFYLALAHQLGCPLLTADPQLRELPGRLASQVAWIGDLG